MLKDNYGIKCRWSGRVESDEQLAQRAAAWFQELSRIDPLLERWYLNAKTPKTAVEVSPTVEVLRDFFARKSRSRKSGPGITFGLWNGQADPDRCDTDVSSSWSKGQWPALCTVNPPWRGELAERLITVEVLEQILRAMVRVWEPDCAEATSFEYMSYFYDTHGHTRNLYCAWLTYLSRRRGEVPALPAPVQVKPVEDKGTLIILTPERFTVTNPAHMALAEEVQGILDQAGLMGPID